MQTLPNSLFSLISLPSFAFFFNLTHSLISEWLVNQQRDSYASYIGHSNMMSFFAVAENTPVARLRLRYLEKMIDPCGAPPPVPPRDLLFPPPLLQPSTHPK